jgi:DNA (cytosine-5)-methyltransferase 1
MVALRELALFAGAGGGLLASRLLGWRTVCAVEINRYRRDVLRARQDDGSLDPFPIWDDIRTFDGLLWRGRVDVVSGGFPCQAYSTAARGRNVADDLWSEMRRIVAETAPRYVFAENTSRAAIEAAAEDLRGMGYETRCTPLAAADLGADHLRPRYWLRSYADDEGELCRELHAEVAGLQSVYSSIWDAYSREPGVVDGVANRMERFEAAGNGQVPIVAATAWRILSSPSTSTCLTTEESK